MFTSERQRDILELVKVGGRVLVDDLVAKFNVTPQTIRADLKFLSKNNKLVRFHGGAQAIDGRANANLGKVTLKNGGRGLLASHCSFPYCSLPNVTYHS